MRWLISREDDGTLGTEILTKAIIDRLERTPAIKVGDRATALLRYLADCTDTLGSDVDLFSKKSARVTYSFGRLELEELATFLADLGFVTRSAFLGSSFFKVTPQGFIHLDQANLNSTEDSTQSFVAMWFDKSIDFAFTEAISPAILESGYTPLRIDQKEHINKIDDEILAEIRRSKFIVADFTGHRGGVYFEAGFALGLGIPIIWACQKNDMSSLHFDIRQYNCIDWTSLDDYRSRLQRRIVASFGLGPSQSS